MRIEPIKIWTANDPMWDRCEDPMVDRLPVKIKSIFTADLLEKRTGKLAFRAAAPNKVLQSAYLAIIGGQHPRDSFNWIAVGHSNLPTHTGQTGLIDTSGISGNVANGQTSGGPYTNLNTPVPNSFSWSYTAFWPSAYGNGELWEVGLTGPNGLFLNRALFLNGQGQSVSIPKDSGHFMRITVQVNFSFTRS